MSECVKKVYRRFHKCQGWDFDLVEEKKCIALHS